MGFWKKSDVLCMAHLSTHAQLLDKIERKGFQLVCLSKPSPPRVQNGCCTFLFCFGMVNLVLFSLLHFILLQFIFSAFVHENVKFPLEQQPFDSSYQW